jgi:hypothetical protein
MMFSPPSAAPCSPKEPVVASAAASAKVGGTCAQPPAQVAFRVVKKSLLKAGEELSSGKCGTLPVGTEVTALEVRGNRVRTSAGWLSIVASSGNRLLAPLALAPAAAGSAPPTASAQSSAATVGAAAAAKPAEWLWELKPWERGGGTEGGAEPAQRRFDGEAAGKLEQAYRAYCAGGAGTAKLVLGGAEYKIDLRRMLQCNASTGFERKIERRGGPALKRVAAAGGAGAHQHQPPARKRAADEVWAETQRRHSFGEAATAAKRQSGASAFSTASSSAAPSVHRVQPSPKVKSEPGTQQPRSPFAHVAAGAGATANASASSPHLASVASVSSTNPSWPGPGPQPSATLYQCKGRSTMLWSCKLHSRGPNLGFFVETQVGRMQPMAKCLARDKAPPQGQRVPTQEAGLQLMRTLAKAKMERGYGECCDATPRHQRPRLRQMAALRRRRGWEMAGTAPQ